MMGKKNIEFLEYMSELDPEFTDTKNFKGIRKNLYESKIRPNLPMIAHLKAKGRDDKQIALALGINPGLFSKLKKDFPLINLSLLWGKEVIGDKLEIKLYELAMGGHFKSLEKAIEKLNTAYSKDQSGLIAELGIDKININIVDMYEDTEELDYIKEYEERVKEIENKEKEK